jgi:oligoendopeptidase F
MSHRALSVLSKSAWFALACLALPLAAGEAATDDASARDERPVPTMWDLTDLYPSPEAWTVSFEQTKAAAEKLDAYRGTLGASADSLFKGLDAISSVNRQLIRLEVYASLKGDEDLRIASNQERRQQSESLGTLVGEKTSWLNPEIIEMGAAKVDGFVAERKDLKYRFGFTLADTLRAAPHTLSLESESVLAQSGDALEQPRTIRDQLANAELPYPQFTLPSGESVRLDQPAYERYRQVADRAERKAVFDSFWGTWHKYEGTIGATLTAHVMGDVFKAKARKFDSSLQAALFQSNMPEGVYRTLIAETHAALPTLYRYLRMRKARLGITDDLQYYDNYPTMFPISPVPHFDVRESERLTLAALAPLGEDYLALMRKGFAGQWMNVLPHEGKATGAYMNGSAYDVHPYLLLNHSDNYQGLTTLAHEWGHAVHTLLTHAAQPFEYSNYSTFIAESASIGNEMLVNDYMVEHAASKAEKLFYLGQGLESIRTTYFRQAQFAEFELAIHEEIEHGHPLSGARLNEIYCGVLKRYYGEAEGVMKIDPAYCVEWAYIPHFYRDDDFYVWQYATSMAGAAQLTDAILKQGAPARARFLEMLRAGSSGYAYDLYKKAGIDMATPVPYRALAARMNRLMDEIEALENSKSSPKTKR